MIDAVRESQRDYSSNEGVAKLMAVAVARRLTPSEGLDISPVGYPKSPLLWRRLVMFLHHVIQFSSPMRCFSTGRMEICWVDIGAISMSTDFGDNRTGSDDVQDLIEIGFRVKARVSWENQSGCQNANSDCESVRYKIDH
jgi:hypothetical protein